MRCASRPKGWCMSMMLSRAGRNRSFWRSSRGVDMSISGRVECPQGNQIPGRSGNGKRRKSTAVGLQSCKIDYFGASDLLIPSRMWAFFTDDELAFIHYWLRSWYGLQWVTKREARKLFGQLLWS